MTGNAPFQKCGCCRKVWESWREFLIDPELRLLGFQGSDRLPDANLLVFEHRCGTTVSILTKRLRHILPQDEQEANLPNLFGTATCNQYCRKIENLKACDRVCVNARDRQLILAILEMRQAEGLSGK